LSYGAGEGVKWDDGKAYYWMQKAVDQESKKASVFLELMKVSDEIRLLEESEIDK